MSRALALAALVCLAWTQTATACLLLVDARLGGTVAALSITVETRFGGQIRFAPVTGANMHRFLLPPPFCTQAIATHLSASCPSGRVVTMRDPRRGFEPARTVRMSALCG